MQRVTLWWLLLLVIVGVLLWWLISTNDKVHADVRNVAPVREELANSGGVEPRSGKVEPIIFPSSFPGEASATEAEGGKRFLRGNLEYTIGSLRITGRPCTVTAQKMGELGAEGRLQMLSRAERATEPLAGKAMTEDIPAPFAIEVPEDAVYGLTLGIEGVFNTRAWPQTPRPEAENIPLMVADAVTLHLVGGASEHVAAVEAVSDGFEVPERRSAVRESERIFRVQGPVLLPVVLRIHSAGPSPLTIDLETREAGVRFSLADLRVLRVRVLDAHDKRPLEGATVRLLAGMPFSPDQEPMHTNSEGRAQVPFAARAGQGAEFIAGQLAVAAEGHASITRMLSVSIAEELEILLLHEGQPGGIVVDEKQRGRAGVRVALANSGRMLMRGVTAADGRFTLGSCEPGPPAFDRNTPPRDMMIAPGLALLLPSPGGGLAAQALANWPELADGKLVVQPRSLKLRVRAVLAPDGVPIKGATIHLCPAINEQPLTELTTPVASRANELGEAAFDVLADAQWCVCVTGEGLADDLWQPLRIVNDSATVSVQCWPERTVRFIEPSGAPVRALHVRFYCGARSTSCVTDTDGRIALPPGPPDRCYSWSIEDNGFLPAASMPTAVKPTVASQVIVLDAAVEVGLADGAGPGATRRSGLRALLLARRPDGVMEALGNVSGFHGDHRSPNLQLSRQAEALWVVAAGCHPERHVPTEAPAEGTWRIAMPNRAGPTLVAAVDEERARTVGGGQIELEFHRFLEPELADCVVASSFIFKPLGLSVPIGVDGSFCSPQLIPGKYRMALRAASGVCVRREMLTISGDTAQQLFN